MKLLVTLLESKAYTKIPLFRKIKMVKLKVYHSNGSPFNSQSVSSLVEVGNPDDKFCGNDAQS